MLRIASAIVEAHHNNSRLESERLSFLRRRSSPGLECTPTERYSVRLRALTLSQWSTALIDILFNGLEMSFGRQEFFIIIMYCVVREAKSVEFLVLEVNFRV